jgi:hypothetical protein
MVSGEENIRDVTRLLAMQRGQYSGARNGSRGAGMDRWQRLQFRYVTGDP